LLENLGNVGKVMNHILAYACLLYHHVYNPESLGIVVW